MMADGALELVESILPRVPVRQYVLSFPYELWGILAFQPKLIGEVQRLFIDVIQKWTGERAKEYGWVGGQGGGVVVLQRFNSALGLQPHLHVLVLDGVYTPDGVFRAFNPADQPHLQSLCTRLAERIIRMLKRKGAIREATSDDDDDADHTDPMKACTLLALTAGQRERDEETEDHDGGQRRSKLVVEVEGFNLEATRTVAAEDRAGLEGLCRYLLRPALALKRLSLEEDGSVVYRLRHPDRRGRTVLRMTPYQFLARMSAQIPAPRLCLRRLFGVLAPRSPLRKAARPPGPVEQRRGASGSIRPEGKDGEEKAAKPPTRTAWRELIARVFLVDPTQCRCGGTFRPVAVIRDREQCRRYLEGVGESGEVPECARERGPP